MVPLNFLRATPGFVGVLGLARTGRATCAALQAAGVSFVAWDDQDAERQKAAKAGYPLARLDEFLSAGKLSLLVLSPGIPHLWPQAHPVVAACKAWGVPVVSDLELLFRSLQHQKTPPVAGTPRVRTVGVTGTNGKSTTVALLEHLFRQAGQRAISAGNNGTPVLTLDHEAYDTLVLELSSYQLELTPALCLDVGVFLNISPDHLARHGGMPGYVAAKQRILNRLPLGGEGVVGVDDAACQEFYDFLSPRVHERLIPVSVTRPLPFGLFVDDGRLVDHVWEKGVVGDLRDLKTLPGSHNHQNALTAYAVGRLHGVPREVVWSALSSYQGLAHRQQTIARVGRVTFVNDSKATNADATARALVCYPSILWIAGGQPKEGGIEALKPYFSRMYHVFLIGEAQEAFAKLLRANGVPVTLCGTLDKAVTAVFESLVTDSDNQERTVLLSPACASWDQYPNFEVRGEHFHALVQQHLLDPTEGKTS